jgi:hypothetical protein
MEPGALLTLASLLSLAASGIAAYVAVYVRAQLSDMRVLLVERSETRREACRKEFVSQSDLLALTRRVQTLENWKEARH